MRILNMKAAPGSSKIVAFFDVETEDHFVIKGFKVVEGSKGPFVAVPSEQDRRDKTKYWDRVSVPGDLKADLEKLALMEYKTLPAGEKAPASTSKVDDKDLF